MNNKKIGLVKIFDWRCVYWTTNLLRNKQFVQCTLDHCAERLKERGYLFLNEVYQELSLELTKQGQVAGWIYDEENADDFRWEVWEVTENGSWSYNIGIDFEFLENILDALKDEEDEEGLE